MRFPASRVAPRPLRRGISTETYGRVCLRVLPVAAPFLPVRALPSLLHRIPDQRGVRELLERDDLAVREPPDVGDAGFEEAAGGPVGAAVRAEADDGVPAVDELGDGGRVAVPLGADALEDTGAHLFRSDVRARVREPGHLGPAGVGS